VYDYDLLVIGSGPGGQKAAIAAAKLGKRVAVAERRDMIGGVCVNTGTIPSKTLREAVLYLTGFAQRDMYGASYRVKSEITIADLMARTQHVVGHEVEVIRNQLMRNLVDTVLNYPTLSEAYKVAALDVTNKIRALQAYS
jgi:NAD(P) transhydrogenase